MDLLDVILAFVLGGAIGSWQARIRERERLTQALDAGIGEVSLSRDPRPGLNNLSAAAADEDVEQIRSERIHVATEALAARAGEQAARWRQ